MVITHADEYSDPPRRCVILSACPHDKSENQNG